MKYILSCLIVSLTLSCIQNTKVTDTKVAYSDLIYFKDYNTNLCFCQMNSRIQSGLIVSSITNVPCDSLVLNQIKN